MDLQRRTLWQRLPGAPRRPRFPNPLAAVLAAALVLASQATAAQTAPQDVVRATLDNGLRVVIVRNPLAPVVTTEINYLVGSNEAPEGFPGMAHAQEHMMFRGSPGLSADQLADITAAMGGMFDADTQQTVTQYFFTVPAEDLDVALHIEAHAHAGRPRQRGAVEAGAGRHRAGGGPRPLQPRVRLLHPAAGRDVRRAPPTPTTRWAPRPPSTRPPAPCSRTSTDAWYAPNNAILVIAGDVDPAGRPAPR